MVRVARVLFLLLAAIVGVGGPSSASSPDTVSGVVAGYTYDNHPRPAVSTPTASERAPPETYNRATTYDAVDLRSDGASARQDGPSPSTITTYDDSVLFVQLESAAATTREQALRTSGGTLSLARAGVAAKSADEFVYLASASRRNHILYGDKTGGGHLWPGLPGKTPFPKDWSAGRVMNEVSDVATDPSSIFRTGRGGSTIATDTRGGVDIRVILRDGDIITGYPTNLPRNP